MKNVTTIIGCMLLVSTLLFSGYANAQTTTKTANETQPASQAYVLDGASMAVGYQGILSFELPGYDETLNGISFRVWKQPLGLNLSLSHLSRDNGTSDDDAFLLDIRGLYSLIKKRNSRLYAGLELGLGSVDFGGNSESLKVFGPMAGFEFSFSDLPEITFNWDVAYTITDAGDYEENGIKVSMGIHYLIN